MSRYMPPMSKYVRADFIIYENDEFCYENGALYSLSGNSTPCIDIIHCNECKHQKDCERILVLNSMYGEIEDCANLDFCSYGIRKGEDDE